MKVDYSSNAKKQLKKLDRQIQSRIVDYMDEVGALQDPRTRGKSLASNLAGLWRYRVGDYRVICNIVDNELLILAVDIGHRREIYRP